MTTHLKLVCSGGMLLLILAGALFVFYPEKASQSKQSIEAVGAVAVDQVISSMEDRVGKTAVAMEHYNTVQKAKRQSLIELKTLKADCERKAGECKLAAATLRAQGKEAAAAAKESEQVTFETQLTSLTASVEKSETSYKEFNQFMLNKKIELDTLKAKTEMLKGELVAMNGADAGFAMKRARELEEEVKSTCSRLESEMQVQQLDEEAN